MTENENAIIKKGPDKQDWYVVAHAVDLTTAEIPAGLLRSAHIPVYLFREAISSSALPLPLSPLGGVQVAVPAAYYEEALALLDVGTPAWDELPPGDDETSPAEPGEDA